MKAVVNDEDDSIRLQQMNVKDISDPTFRNIIMKYTAMSYLKNHVIEKRKKSSRTSSIRISYTGVEELYLDSLDSVTRKQILDVEKAIKKNRK